MTTVTDTREQLQPFRIAVPDSDVVDLRDRLSRTRWAPEPDTDAETYGVSRRRVHELVKYWLDQYDWWVWEGRLNQHPQFTTTIDGTNVHFLHVRSPEPESIPLTQPRLARVGGGILGHHRTTERSTTAWPRSFCRVRPGDTVAAWVRLVG